MIVLKIYLISTAISWLVIGSYAVASAYKMKREGYVTVKDSKSFAEKFVNWLFTLIKGSIPILNVAISLMIIFNGEKMYEEVKEEMLKKGKIYMPEKEKIVVEVNPEEEQSFSEEIIKSQNSNELNDRINMYDKKIDFLKKEKESVLSQSQSLTDEMSSNYKIENSPILKRRTNTSK